MYFIVFKYTGCYDNLISLRGWIKYSIYLSIYRKHTSTESDVIIKLIEGLSRFRYETKMKAVVSLTLQSQWCPGPPMIYQDKCASQRPALLYGCKDDGTRAPTIKVSPALWCETNLFIVWLCCISAAWFMARIQPFMSSCVSALKKYVRIPQCSACEPITEFLL